MRKIAHAPLVVKFSSPVLPRLNIRAAAVPNVFTCAHKVEQIVPLFLPKANAGSVQEFNSGGFKRPAQHVQRRVLRCRLIALEVADRCVSDFGLLGKPLL